MDTKWNYDIYRTFIEMVKGLYSILLLFLCHGFISCVKDVPRPPVSSIPDSPANSVLILNEGGYGNNNADISLFVPDSQKIYNDLFRQATGFSLGDVAQFLLPVENHFWISMNNSGMLRGIDTSSFQAVQNIPVAYPRSLCLGSPSTLYCGQLYRKTIQCIDPAQARIKGEIVLPFSNPEQMICRQDYLWVATWDTACAVLLGVDTASKQVVKTIPLQGRAPHSLAEDRMGRIWILSGNKYKKKTSYLHCYDPITNQMLKELAFPETADPFRLRINLTGDTLYFLQVNYSGGNTNNGLYRMAISENQLPEKAFIQALPNSYYWAFGLDAQRHQIYLSDPRGFNQRSLIQVFNLDGQFQFSFDAGIGANQFIFKP